MLASAILASADDITPRIGDIEVYGVRKVSIQKVKHAIGGGPGDPLPSREEAEERIDKISGVVASRIEATCCAGRNLILYVGIEERDAPRFEFHSTPTGTLQLPSGILEKYQAFLEAVSGSLRGKNADEDLTNGYSLMADPDSREIQLSFVPMVAENLAVIDKVLRESADADQRVAAAYLLQYGPRGPHQWPVLVNGLMYGLQDQDDIVRQNAVRGLRAVAVGAKLHPDQQIRIQPTWFIEMLNSVVWSDRRNATLALVNLTESRNSDTLALLRERALLSVIEMARWHQLQHALPAFILAGRLAGFDEQEIKDAWVSGDREAVLEQALHPNHKPHRQAKKTS
jgi:hypothetical protein